MLKLRISLREDWQRLRKEGCDVWVQAGHLVVDGIPYVNSEKEVKRGKLVSKIELEADVVVGPKDHVIHFAGEYPCHADGSPLEKIRHNSGRNELAEDLVVDHSFSSKPPQGYADYYEKIMSYATILYSQAQAVDSNATPHTFPVVRPDEDDDSPFRYIDTASIRAGVVSLSEKLKLTKVAIIGLGGTGSYILDLLAKAPVKEIHVFDGDVFDQHTAFRSPGAASIRDLERKPKKVNYFHEKYDPMHAGIVPHDYYITEANVDELKEMNFVFLSIDKPEPKKPIVHFLSACNITFIDVGMGISKTDGKLEGMLRVTTSTPEKRLRHRIPTDDTGVVDEYDENIQIADLNMQNAALAVQKFKKMLGFYADTVGEQHSVYVIDTNTLTNEETTE
jgi:Dinucleotide-utilizing enzymes involved in molybdopterin and thiamine biosynthesis family 1